MEIKILKTAGFIRRTLVVPLCLGLMCFCLLVMSCVKQKNCEEGMSGTFQYVKGQLDGYSNKLMAIFYVDGDTLSPRYIEGYIPKEYRSNELIKVRVCLQEKMSSPMLVYLPSYKLICIEKED